jgi:hypothetical protein
LFVGSFVGSSNVVWIFVVDLSEGVGIIDDATKAVSVLFVGIGVSIGAGEVGVGDVGVGGIGVVGIFEDEEIVGICVESKVEGIVGTNVIGRHPLVQAQYP